MTLTLVLIFSLAIGYFVPGVWDAVREAPAVSVLVDPDWAPSYSEPLQSSYIIPRPVELIGPPPNNADHCEDRYNWAHSMGGMDANWSALRVLVTGNLSGRILLTGFEARLIHRASSYPGNVVTCTGVSQKNSSTFPSPSTNESPAPTLLGDICSVRPQFRLANSRSLAFTIAKGETQPFYFLVNAKGCSGEWEITLSIVVYGKRMSITLDDHGKPFLTSGTDDSKKYVWRKSSWTLARS
jgi:hypothetical protein